MYGSSISFNWLQRCWRYIVFFCVSYTSPLPLLIDNWHKQMDGWISVFVWLNLNWTCGVCFVYACEYFCSNMMPHEFYVDYDMACTKCAVFNGMRRHKKRRTTLSVRWTVLCVWMHRFFRFYDCDRFNATFMRTRLPTIWNHLPVLIDGVSNATVSYT